MIQHLIHRQLAQHDDLGDAEQGFALAAVEHGGKAAEHWPLLDEPTARILNEAAQWTPLAKTQAISFAMSNVSIKMCPPCLRTPVHHVSGTYTPEGGGTDRVVLASYADLNQCAELTIKNELGE